MTRRLRVSELFRLMEEASIAHTEQLGCTREKTLDRGLLWIIARQTAEIDELPAYDDEIVVKSWQGDMMHVFFPRFYEIWRGDRCLVRGQALWMLIDEKTRDMVMPEDYDISIPGRPGSGDMMIPAVQVPAGTDRPDIEQDVTVTYSRVDINGHMNNTRYFDIIDDALWGYRSGRRRAGEEATSTAAAAALMTQPRRITANYLSELRAGDGFTLRGYRQTGTGCGEKWTFDGAADKVRFRVTAEYR